MSERKKSETERLREKLREKQLEGMEDAIKELAEELKKEKKEEKNKMVEAIALLGEKVLVPIVAAAIGAIGAYYVQIAGAAKESAVETVKEELDKADDARAFVDRHLPAMASPAIVGTAAAAEVRPDNATLEKLIELWKTERAARLMAAAATVTEPGESPPRPEPDPKMDKPPVDYIKRAMQQRFQQGLNTQEQWRPAGHRWDTATAHQIQPLDQNQERGPDDTSVPDGVTDPLTPQDQDQQPRDD